MALGIPPEAPASAPGQNEADQLDSAVKLVVDTLWDQSRTQLDRALDLSQPIDVRLEAWRQYQAASAIVQQTIGTLVITPAQARQSASSGE